MTSLLARDSQFVVWVSQSLGWRKSKFRREKIPTHESLCLSHSLSLCRSPRIYYKIRVRRVRRVWRVCVTSTSPRYAALSTRRPIVLCKQTRLSAACVSLCSPPILRKTCVHHRAFWFWPCCKPNHATMTMFCMVVCAGWQRPNNSASNRIRLTSSPYRTHRALGNVRLTQSSSRALPSGVWHIAELGLRMIRNHPKSSGIIIRNKSKSAYFGQQVYIE